MLNLTAPQATLLVATITTLGALIGWLGRGSAFLLRRWWTATPQQEQAAYLNSVADLAGKLRAHGMTIDDVRQLEAIMRSPALAGRPSATQLFDVVSEEAAEPDAFGTNNAIKARTHAAYDVANAQLEQAIMDLRLLVRHDEVDALLGAHERWRAYRKALEESAGMEFRGGTHEPLAGLIAGLAETERRTAEIRASVAERASR